MPPDATSAPQDRAPAPRTSRAPTVAIVGRPNVGKSTLFNRILGRRQAIVSEEEGVTRDRQFAAAEWAGRQFMLADTGGLREAPDRRLEAAVREQVLTAIDHADVILFVVDAQAGLHPVDEYVAELLRKADRPCLLVANKVDDPVGAVEHLEFYELGLGDPVPVSALNGKGSGDMLDELVRLLPETFPGEGLRADLELAVVGRPNVGKSSFVNRLLGEDRVIVHEEGGTTRDSIDTYFEFEDRRVCLIDTAGLRRESRVRDDLEFYSRVRTAAAVDRADVCAVLVDVRQGVANQDFSIGQEAWDSGCGLVFVPNKWDLIEDQGPEVVARFQEELRERAPYLRWVPIVTASALTGKRVRKVLEIALDVQGERQRRIPTPEVNEVLQELTGRRQPPQGPSGDVRLYYGTQADTEPPLFVLWANRPSELADHYLRYLRNGFRDEWGFRGTPIRVKVRKREDRTTG